MRECRATAVTQAAAPSSTMNPIYTDSCGHRYKLSFEIRALPLHICRPNHSRATIRLFARMTTILETVAGPSFKISAQPCIKRIA
ncbi:unnamed protein product, partial [Nesidiocoris tenuis]